MHSHKTLTGWLFVLLCNAALAAPTTTTITATLTGQITPGCVFTKNTGSAHFGTLAANNVATSTSTLEIVCSANTSYAIKPTVARKSFMNSSNETLTLSAYRDSALAQAINDATPLTGTSVGVAPTALSIYFKLEGQGEDKGQGKGLTSTGSFTTTYDFTIVH